VLLIYHIFLFPFPMSIFDVIFYRPQDHA